MDRYHQRGFSLWKIKVNPCINLSNFSKFILKRKKDKFRQKFQQKTPFINPCTTPVALGSSWKSYST